jgi:hypothetical protein
MSNETNKIEHKFKLTKTKFLYEMVTEMSAMLCNGHTAAYNGMWFGLFGIYRDEYIDNPNEQIILNIDGEEREMTVEEIDEYIYDNCSNVETFLDESISNENGLILLLNE